MFLLTYENLVDRIQDTKAKIKAIALGHVSRRNGLAMAIAMTKITCAGATGMVVTVAARKSTYSTAHTVSAEIQRLV